MWVFEYTGSLFYPEMCQSKIHREHIPPVEINICEKYWWELSDEASETPAFANLPLNMLQLTIPEISNSLFR
jgi:hypothetical protein